MMFKAGQAVWILCTATNNRCGITGVIAGVVRGPCDTFTACMYLPHAVMRGETVYSVDSDMGHFAVAESALRPRHEPYEGDNAGNWQTCPFKPEGARA